MYNYLSRYIPNLATLNQLCNKKDQGTGLKSFWNYCQELAELNRLDVKGEQILIPRWMRAGILDQLHASHLGTGKTKERARTSVFWPDTTQDIKKD